MIAMGGAIERGVRTPLLSGSRASIAITNKGHVKKLLTLSPSLSFRPGSVCDALNLILESSSTIELAEEDKNDWLQENSKRIRAICRHCAQLSTSDGAPAGATFRPMGHSSGGVAATRWLQWALPTATACRKQSCGVGWQPRRRSCA